MDAIVQVTDFERRPDHTIWATAHYASGLKVVRQVKSMEVSAKITRAADGSVEDLGVVSEAHSNLFTEQRLREERGSGQIRLREAPCE